MENNAVEHKKDRKKTLLIAFVVLGSFFLVSKILSSISTNPAQQSYETHCASCHGNDGKGLKELIPPLAGSDWLLQNQDKLVCVLKYGMSEAIEVNGVSYQQQMDGINLNDIQIYNIINYINSSWGNDIPKVQTNEVLRDLKKCKEN